MAAMIDVSCPKCRRRFGWCGTMRNQPSCPRCGHRPPQAELDAAEDVMTYFAEQLRTHPGLASAEMRRQQRVDAGLTLRQAARQLGITAVELSDYESCRAEPSAALCERMAAIYGVGEA